MKAGGAAALLIAAAYGIGAAAAPRTTGAVYDVVLAGGRVLDPASGLDAVRDVGITGGRIAALSKARLRGRERIDCAGRVVAPGFIDLHSHALDPEGNKRQAADGVTTALELEEGVFPVGEWYAARAGRSLLNYGAAAGHIPARIAAFTNVTSGAEQRRIRLDPAAQPAWARSAADAATLERLEQILQRGLDAGGLGIGVEIAESPGATREEVFRVFGIAARHHVPIYAHLRGFGLAEQGGALESAQEMLADAAATGAPLHFVHLGSSALKQAPLFAAMIAGARARGMDVSGEVYPYTAASTFIQVSMFDPGWQERLGIGFNDLQWTATGERLTAESFARRRAEGGFVIIHMIPEATVDFLLAQPDIMVASDALPIVNGRGHPRSSGTFARVLGRYVREKKLLSLMDAVRRMSYLPAERVRGAAPQMARKGRIAAGADADIVVFDPATVSDRATFEEPGLPSAGIDDVLVNGTFVVRGGQPVASVFPGRAVRGAWLQPGSNLNKEKR